MILLLVINIKTTFAYHRNWGPILPPFTPGPIPIDTECDGTRPCLEIPSRKICKEKLSQPLIPWLPIPWWYFFCQMITGPRTGFPLKTTSSTIHPYFKNAIEELAEFKKNRRFSKNWSFKGSNVKL
ncbi:unnamed protein product [Colias eurytheme]|nr:unnamed protein product [Colias eurytheme]